MNTKTFSGFEDLSDDFDAVSHTGIAATIEGSSKMKSLKAETPQKLFVENCPKCNGSGRYNSPSSLGHQTCTKCKGKGKLTFKKPAHERKKVNDSRKAKEREKHLAKVSGFRSKNPEVCAWIDKDNREFANSLSRCLDKYGALTENQINAVFRCIEAQKKQRAEAEVRIAEAKVDATVDISPIVKAINLASSNGLKNPKVRLLAGDIKMIVYNASKSSVNAGSQYVKTTDDFYLGKITDGVFYRARDTTKEQEQEIVKAFQDPMKSAVAYGRATGSCSCCGRELTDGDSIERGIGPICEQKFFGG